MPSTLVSAISEAGAFVYLGAERFQHWVNDAVPGLEDEPDFALIDALVEIDLLEYDDHDHGHGHSKHDAKFFSDPALARRGVENVHD